MCASRRISSKKSHASSAYEHIPTRDSVAVRLTQREPARLATAIIGQALNAAGYFEALTFSFVSDALSESFKHADAAKLHKVLSATRKADAQLRPSILPNLLESVARNENVGVAGAKLFETASTFWIDANGKSVERRAVGIVGSTDYAELRGAVETMLKRLDARRAIHISPSTRAGFGANACGEVRWGDVSIGTVGKTDRKVAEQLGLKELPAIAELWLEPLVAGYVAVPQLVPLPSFPAVRRDLSLLLNETVRYEQIEQLVQELKLDALEAMEFVHNLPRQAARKGNQERYLHARLPKARRHPHQRRSRRARGQGRRTREDEGWRNAACIMPRLAIIILGCRLVRASIIFPPW